MKDQRSAVLSGNPPKRSGDPHGCAGLLSKSRRHDDADPFYVPGGGGSR